ncbi:MAG: hypothetical protein AB8E82_04565 [Aureispira sp.]
MKNLFLIVFVFLALYACEEQEVLEATETSTTVSSQKSASSEYANNADFTYPITSEQDLETVVNTLSPNDIVVVEQGTAYVFEGLAPLWMDPTTINGKKVCKGLGGIAFAKCVYKHIKAGEKVLIWMDENGGFNASI